MKYPPLLFLLWAAAFLRLDAQRELPPSLLPYAAHWSQPVKSLFETAGFDLADVQAVPATWPMAHSRNLLQLDSTIRFVNYPDSMPFTRISYSAPDEGVTVATESEHLGGKWEPLTRTTTIKDELGRDVDIIAQRYDPHMGDFVPDSRIQLFPRGNSTELVDSFVVWAWDGQLGDYSRQLATAYVYDEHDRILEGVTSVAFLGFPFYLRDYYTYTKDGLLVIILSFNDDGETQVPTGMRGYAYIGHTRVAEMELLPDGLGGFLPQTRWEYAYTGNGLQDTVTTFAWDVEKANWREVRLDDSDYDAGNRLVAKTSFFRDEEGTAQRERLTYDYVQDQYLAFTASWTWDDDLADWQQLERTWYYYADLVSASPMPSPANQSLELSPNPTTGQVHVQLAGTHISVYVYTISGQLLRHVILAPDETMIDLSGLPVGIYQLRALSSEGIYAGRVVVQ
jgi:hypothetical protein